MAEKASWRLKCHSLEACNCNHGCGCQFAGFPDHGGCEFIIGYEVKEGSFGEVDLKGRRVVVAAKYPGAIHEGNGNVALFVDDGASPEQVTALATIYSGQAGGMPWEAIAGTIGKVDGPNPVRIDLNLNGLRSTLRVPDVLEVEFSPLFNPVTGAEQNVHITYPEGGFFWNDGAVGTTKTMRMNYKDIQFEHPGQFANVAEANWSNAG